MSTSGHKEDLYATVNGESEVEEVLDIAEKTDDDAEVEVEAELEEKTKRKRAESVNTQSDDSVQDEKSAPNVVHVAPKKIKSQVSHDIQKAEVPTTKSNTYASANVPTGPITMMYIAPDKVGHIIGSKGMIIQELQTRSGCRMTLNQDFPAGVNRTLEFLGTPDQIAKAVSLVNLILTIGPTAIHPNNQEGGGMVVSHEINCPQSVVGRVIGTAGATIKELQTRTGAKIQVNQDFPDGVDRKVVVTGTQQAVVMASQLIQHVIQNGSVLPPAPTPTYSSGYMQQPQNVSQMMSGGVSMQPVTGAAGGNSQQVIEVTKNLVGKIIGKGGETINLIQKKSGARVQIDQNVQPCKVIVSGSTQVRSLWIWRKVISNLVV
jgi:rRNA processing protein Krr1/Pno1